MIKFALSVVIKPGVSHWKRCFRDFWMKTPTKKLSVFCILYFNRKPCNPNYNVFTYEITCSPTHQNMNFAVFEQKRSSKICLCFAWDLVKNHYNWITMFSLTKFGAFPSEIYLLWFISQRTISKFCCIDMNRHKWATFITKITLLLAKSHVSPLKRNICGFYPKTAKNIFLQVASFWTTITQISIDFLSDLVLSHQEVPRSHFCDFVAQNDHQINVCLVCST